MKNNMSSNKKSLLNYLLSFARPYIKPLFLALVFVAFSTVLELINPYLVKVAIDNHISGDIIEMIEVDKSSQNQDLLEINGKKYLRIHQDEMENYKDEEVFYTIRSQGRDHTLLRNGEDFEKIPHENYRAMRQADAQAVIKIALMYILVIICNFLMTWAFNFLLGRTGSKIIYDIRERIFGHLVEQSSEFYNKRSVGSLMTRVTSDTQTLSEFYSNVMVSFIADLGVIIGIMILMLKLNTRLALMCFTLLPIIIIISTIFTNIQFKIFRLARSKLSRINTRLNEYLSGMSVISIFGKQEKIEKKFDDQNSDYLSTVLKSIRNNALFKPSIEIVRSLGEAFLIYYGGGQVIQNNIEFGTLFLFITYLKRFFMPIMDMAEKYNIFQLALASVEKIVDILNVNTGLKPLPEYSKNNFKAKRGDIEFKNVNFSYVEGEPVLKNISFKIKAGESVAFVGATGSGKTSILSLLARLWDVDSGSITIDGVDIRTMDTGSLRKRLGLVLQDVFLFSVDIKYNISLGKKYSENQIIDAATRVRAHEFIKKLPDGYDTAVQERGSTLSTGERQLLSFARTIIRDPEILMLDEATASIDTETELLIQEGLEELMKNRTTIAVAHRLSTISNMDRIIVMNRGQIVEVGNHKELMEKKGYYYKLYQLQLEEKTV